MSGVDTFDDAKASGYYAGYRWSEQEKHHDPQRYAWGRDDFEHQRNTVHHVTCSPYTNNLDVYSRMRLFFPPVIETRLL